MSKRKPEDVDAGLKALVLHAGNATEAAKETGIPQETLRTWRNNVYRERYEALRESYEQAVDKELGEDLLNITKRITGSVITTLDDYDQAMSHKNYKEARDAAQAVKALMTAGGISNQNSRIIREKPTEVRRLDVDVTRVEQAMRALLDGESVIEAQAIEIESGER